MVRIHGFAQVPVAISIEAVYQLVALIALVSGRPIIVSFAVVILVLSDVISLITTICGRSIGGVG